MKINRKVCAMKFSILYKDQGFTTHAEHVLCRNRIKGILVLYKNFHYT